MNVMEINMNILLGNSNLFEIKLVGNKKELKLQNIQQMLSFEFPYA